MIQVPNYTKENFDDDYFHYSGNNRFFIEATLIPRSTNFTRENCDNYLGLKVEPVIAEEKLGPPSFISDWDTQYWIFELNGDTFYYQNDPYSGSTIGIYCGKNDKSQNWLFHPDEYENQENDDLGKKMLAFCKEIAKKLG